MPIAGPPINVLKQTNLGVQKRLHCSNDFSRVLRCVVLRRREGVKLGQLSRRCIFTSQPLLTPYLPLFHRGHLSPPTCLLRLFLCLHPFSGIQKTQLTEHHSLFLFFFFIFIFFLSFSPDTFLYEYLYPPPDYPVFGFPLSIARSTCRKSDD